jgi:arylformamidase
MWREGSPYQRKSIYQIKDGELPPVNYDEHRIKSHSLTHAEAPKHTQSDGKSIDQFFAGNYFHGKCTVTRLKGDGYKKMSNDIYHWEVSLTELKNALNNSIPNKLLLSTDIYHLDSNGYHDPNYVLTLSLEAAEWLVSNSKFNLYGTSWKSSDYSPGSAQRPVHNKLFTQAVILENLDLSKVPEGEYFLVAYPIRIEGASESPVTPVLFNFDEL